MGFYKNSLLFFILPSPVFFYSLLLFCDSMVSWNQQDLLLQMQQKGEKYGKYFEKCVI